MTVVAGVENGVDATRVVAWALAIGGVVFSTVMVWRTVRAYRLHHRAGLPFPGLLRMTVRRSAIGLLLGIVCVLLFLGVEFVDAEDGPLFVGIYWSVVLLLLVWLLVLAVADLLHSARRLNRFLDWENEERKKHGEG